jgi:hypothetical protein
VKESVEWFFSTGIEIWHIARSCGGMRPLGRRFARVADVRIGPTRDQDAISVHRRTSVSERQPLKISQHQDHQTWN